jgi:hypothetical protein
MKTVFGAAIVTALVLTQHTYPQEPATTLEQREKQLKLLAWQYSLLQARQLVSDAKTSSKSTLLRLDVAAELRGIIVESPDTPEAKEAAELLGKLGPTSTYFDGMQWELHHPGRLLWR